MLDFVRICMSSCHYSKSHNASTKRCASAFLASVSNPTDDNCMKHAALDRKLCWKQDNGYSLQNDALTTLRPIMKKCMVFAQVNYSHRLVSFIPLSTMECNETTRLHNNGSSVYIGKLPYLVQVVLCQQQKWQVVNPIPSTKLY